MNIKRIVSPLLAFLVIIFLFAGHVSAQKESASTRAVDLAIREMCDDLGGTDFSGKGVENIAILPIWDPDGSEAETAFWDWN